MTDSGRRPWWEGDPKLADHMRRQVALAKLEVDSGAASRAAPAGQRELVVARCGEGGCGLKLARVTATRLGPLYQAWIPWTQSAVSRYGQPHRLIVGLAEKVDDPELFGFAVESARRSAEDHYRENRGELALELLDHPCPVELRDPLFVRCRRHLDELEVDRERLSIAIRTAAQTRKPTKLLLPERPTRDT